MLRVSLMDLPINLSLSYFWCCGFVLGVFMVLQIVSGVVLSFFYDAASKFSSLMMWSNEGLTCWLMRYIHVWCVSLMFLLVLVHISRSLYYGSYSRLGVWKVGFVLYVLMMVEAFLGYILPWHQMSYWAATVLTSMLLSFPLVGVDLYSYIVGGFSVTVGETLIRVFSAHVCLGFIMLGLVCLHIYFLHRVGSSCPLFICNGYSDSVRFHSYYTIKDLYVFFVLLSLLLFCLMFCPYLVLDCEAFLEAKNMVTPVSIKPEWYFLAYYAMLRSVESKVGGVLLVAVFLLLLWLPSCNVPSSYCLVRQYCFWSIVMTYLALSFVGFCHAGYYYVLVSKLCSFVILLLLGVYKFCWALPYSVSKFYFNK